MAPLTYAVPDTEDHAIARRFLEDRTPCFAAGRCRVAQAIRFSGAFLADELGMRAGVAAEEAVGGIRPGVVGYRGILRGELYSSVPLLARAFEIDDGLFHQCVSTNFSRRLPCSRR